ncbi:MAG: phosphoglycerate dehydrogenase [Clostridiales bacterium]|jgi:D-3-phosphoglycerate dehydrogenase|nr:phosphoglycerate dehydrogenase [Clostridiales bacterium]
MDILKLNSISPAADEILKSRFNVTDKSDNPIGIIVRSYNMHDFPFGRDLLCIARAGAGVNNIPIERCTKSGVVVFNTPGANANAVKELVICCLLLASRKIIPAIEWTKSLKGKGSEVPALVEKGKSCFVGPEIYGKKLGVIGIGAIGALVANAAAALGMDVLGYDPYISVESAWGLSRNVKRITDINELYSLSDYISIHVPCNSSTKGQINRDSISKMKDGVVIINCSRGELVETQDIIDAVKSGKVARYVTDFPNDDLLGVENVICIPHLGASTPEAEDNCAIAAAMELADYIENGNINNSVNFPTCTMARSGVSRIAIIHLNIKDMINKITSKISAQNHNISNFVNKSQREYAYSMIDIDDVADEKLKKEIESIEGVIRVRIIK